MKITNSSEQVIHNVTSSFLYKSIDNNIYSCYITINTSSYYRVIDRYIWYLRGLEMLYLLVTN